MAFNLWIKVIKVKLIFIDVRIIPENNIGLRMAERNFDNGMIKFSKGMVYVTSTLLYWHFHNIAVNKTVENSKRQKRNFWY